MLHQPIHDLLANARHVLIAGCGGGYDILGGVPIAHELMQRGRTVTLASLSFMDCRVLRCPRPNPRLENLYAITGDLATPDAYCPEAWLARWWSIEYGDATVWTFDKTGVVPLRAAYEYLVERLGVDAIIVVDGGIDSLLRGDESELGTPEEDFTTLTAVQGLRGPVKVLTCVGLGAETRDGICHEQVFERMRELTRAEAYLGASAMVPSTATARYLTALDYVTRHQQHQRRSYVHDLIRHAVAGTPPAESENSWATPLSSMYWFFRLDGVADTNLILPALTGTHTIQEVTARIEGARKSLHIRDRTTIPL